LPRRAAESGGDPLHALAAQARIRHGIRPSREAANDRLDDRRRAIAPILPRQIAVPVPPIRRLLAGGAGLARQAQIADRNHPPAILGAVAVGESVELLHIAERVVGLALDPIAQPGLERTVAGLEGPRRQGLAALDGQDARLLAGHG